MKVSDYDFEILEENDYVMLHTEGKTLGKIAHINETTGNVAVEWRTGGTTDVSIIPAYKLIKIGPEDLI